MPQEILYNNYDADDHWFVDNESSILFFEYQTDRSQIGFLKSVM